MARIRNTSHTYGDEVTFVAATPSQAVGELVVCLDRKHRVDIDVLEDSISHRHTREWVLARLSDIDPYVPLDTDSQEQPWELFVDLWFRAAGLSQVRTCLSTACCDLLLEAWESKPKAWHADLLRLVTHISPPHCKRFLLSVAATKDFDTRMIKKNLDIRWLEAAACYEPGTRREIEIWEDRLGNSRYRVLAFNALATSLEHGIEHLPDYFTALQGVAHRELLFEQAVRVLLNHSPHLCFIGLKASRSEFERTDGLCDAIDKALVSLGRPQVFDQPVITATPVLAAQTTQSRDYLTDIALWNDRDVA